MVVGVDRAAHLRVALHHPAQQQAVGAPPPVVALGGSGDMAVELDVGRGVDGVEFLAADVDLLDRLDERLAGPGVAFVGLAAPVEGLAHLAGRALRGRVAGAGVVRGAVFAEEFVVFDEADQFEEVAALGRAGREFGPAPAEDLPAFDHPAALLAERDRRDPVVVVGGAEKAGVRRLAALGLIAIDARFAFEYRPFAASGGAVFFAELGDRFVDADPRGVVAREQFPDSERPDHHDGSQNQRDHASPRHRRSLKQM